MATPSNSNTPNTSPVNNTNRSSVSIAELPSRKPGRPAQYVFDRDEAELTPEELRLKRSIEKRRLRQNAYHQRKRERLQETFGSGSKSQQNQSQFQQQSPSMKSEEKSSPSHHSVRFAQGSMATGQAIAEMRLNQLYPLQQQQQQQQQQIQQQQQPNRMPTPSNNMSMTQQQQQQQQQRHFGLSQTHAGPMAPSATKQEIMAMLPDVPRGVTATPPSMMNPQQVPYGLSADQKQPQQKYSGPRPVRTNQEYSNYNNPRNIPYPLPPQPQSQSQAQPQPQLQPQLQPQPQPQLQPQLQPQPQPQPPPTTYVPRAIIEPREPIGPIYDSSNRQGRSLSRGPRGMEPFRDLSLSRLFSPFRYGDNNDPMNPDYNRQGPLQFPNMFNPTTPSAQAALNNNNNQLPSNPADHMRLASQGRFLSPVRSMGMADLMARGGRGLSVGLGLGGDEDFRNAGFGSRMRDSSLTSALARFHEPLERSGNPNGSVPPPLSRLYDINNAAEVAAKTGMNSLGSTPHVAQTGSTPHAPTALATDPATNQLTSTASQSTALRKAGSKQLLNVLDLGRIKERLLALPVDEQDLLHRLVVFPSSFDLHASMYVLGQVEHGLDKVLGMFRRWIAQSFIAPIHLSDLFQLDMPVYSVFDEVLDARSSVRARDNLNLARKKFVEYFCIQLSSPDTLGVSKSGIHRKSIIMFYDQHRENIDCAIRYAKELSHSQWWNIVDIVRTASRFCVPSRERIVMFHEVLDSMFGHSSRNPSLANNQDNHTKLQRARLELALVEAYFDSFLYAESESLLYRLVANLEEMDETACTFLDHAVHVTAILLQCKMKLAGGMYDAAQGLVARALGICGNSGMGYSMLAVNGCGYLCTIHIHENELEKAENTAHEVMNNMELFSFLNMPEYADVLGLLGCIEFLMARYQDAEKRFDFALRIIREWNESSLWAINNGSETSSAVMPIQYCQELELWLLEGLYKVHVATYRKSVAIHLLERAKTLEYGSRVNLAQSLILKEPDNVEPTFMKRWISSLRHVH